MPIIEDLLFSSGGKPDSNSSFPNSHGLFHLWHQTANGGWLLEAYAIKLCAWSRQMHRQASGMAVWQVARQAESPEPLQVNGNVLAHSLVELSVKKLLERRKKCLRVMYSCRTPVAYILLTTNYSLKTSPAGLSWSGKAGALGWLAGHVQTFSNPCRVCPRASTIGHPLFRLIHGQRWSLWWSSVSFLPYQSTNT